MLEQTFSILTNKFTTYSSFQRNIPSPKKKSTPPPKSNRNQHMHLAIPERLGCTDILFKINKLSKIFICRLEKRKIGNNQPTPLPSWHLREPSVYTTPRTSEPPAPELARGAHAHRPCLEREQWERREGASPAPRAPQLPGPDPRSTPRTPSAPRAPPAPAPDLRGAAHLRRAGPGLHSPNRVRAMVKALADCSLPPPVHALPPGRPEVTAPAGGAHTSQGVSRSRRGVVAAGAPGGGRPGRRRPLQGKVIDALLSGAPGSAGTRWPSASRRLSLPSVH